MMLIFAFQFKEAFAQGIGINNPSPDPTAALDIASNSKGVLIPRVSTAERIAIGGGTPANGLLVYDNTTLTFWYYNGSDWKELSGGGDTDWTETADEVYTTKDVGIGISNPGERHHVHATSGTSFSKYTVTNSGVGAGDGLLIGLDGANQAYIRQKENLPIFFYTNDQLRMRLTETGKLGIGINSPATVLDVGGAGTQYARVTSTSGATNGIEFVRQGSGQDWRWTNSNGFFDLYNVTNDFASAATSDIIATFTNTGRLGIGTINPQQPLHIIGTIRSSVLSGSGNRPVVANANGDLVVSAAPTTQYWAANGFAFNSSSSFFTFGSIAFSTAGTTSIWASINLPQGATVTSFYINYGDISTISNINVRLLRVNTPGNFIQSTMSDITSSGTPGASSPALTDFTITDPVIDNTNSTYLIEVRPQPGTSWDSNRINIRNVRISYTLPN